VRGMRHGCVESLRMGKRRQLQTPCIDSNSHVPACEAEMLHAAAAPRDRLAQAAEHEQNRRRPMFAPSIPLFLRLIMVALCNRADCYIFAL